MFAILSCSENKTEKEAEAPQSPGSVAEISEETPAMLLRVPGHREPAAEQLLSSHPAPPTEQQGPAGSKAQVNSATQQKKVNKLNNSVYNQAVYKHRHRKQPM